MAKRNDDRQLADDALAIDRARAADGRRTEYRIGAPGLQGFTLRVEPSGRATYWVRYSVNKIERRLRDRRARADLLQGRKDHRTEAFAGDR